MNKFFTKIAAATVGFAMAIGVGVVIANAEAKEVNAATGEVFQLVKDTSTLESGDKVVIGSGTSGNIYLLSTTQNTNNRAATGPLAVSSEKVTLTDVVQVLTLGQSNSHWTLGTGSGYLYASSSSSNQLKTQTTVNSNGEWAITVSNSGVASIVAQGNNTRNVMQYNSGSTLFACYGSASQVNVAIYKKTVDSSKTIQANSITIKSGEQVITGTYEPEAPYYIADRLNLTTSIVVYEEGDDFESGEGKINWTSSDTNVATISNGIVTYVSQGTTTITATAVDKGENDSTVSASFVLNISSAGEARGTANNPYTVSEAKNAVDESGNVTDVYVKGIVSKFPNNPFDSNNGYISYYISADGATTGFQLEAYKGKGIGGADFESANDIKVGAAVVVKGNLLKYNSTYELAQDNELVSYVTPFTVSFETNGGSSIDPQIVLDGETAQKPADPTKAATQDYTYSFADWYDNQSLTGDPYDFNTPVTADLVLYAKWNEIPAPAKEVVARMTTATQLSYRYTKEGNGVRDYLTRAFTGVNSTNSYSTWSNKTGTSGAVYAGQSAGEHDAIQLRSNNNNSGVITTVSGGNARAVKVVWNSNTASGRTVDVYGKNTAYEAATELYNPDKQGTKIGTLTAEKTVLEITDEYAYIGIRSSNGALYLDSIMIQWGELSYDYSDISIRFGGNVTKDLWNRLDNESTIEGFGVMITESKNVENFSEFKEYIEADMFKSSEISTDADKDIVDYFVPIANMNSIIGETSSNYFWNLRFEIDKANMYKDYSAIAYIKIENEYVLMNMATESVESLAIYNLTDGGYDTTAAGGSLQNIVDRIA